MKAVPAYADTIPSPTKTVTAEDSGYTYKYYDFTYKSSKQKLHTIESKPSDTACKYEFVLHHISDGNGGYTLTRVLDIAKNYEAQSGRKVIAATNGDFFVNSSGYKPVESYVVGGVVLQQTTNVSGNYATKNSFGWDNKGKVVTGKMSELTTMLTVTYNNTSKTFEIEKINEEPSDGCIAIYNKAGTYNNVKGAGSTLSMRTELLRERHRALLSTTKVSKCKQVSLQSL
ncbi:MAG: hypothetical protein K2N18_03345 [Clostridia bacterium]|nr:hypothetical protein [Clostridia bacterium]